MILDTNALSAVADEHTTITQVLANADQIELPVIVLGEYRYGITQSRHQAQYKRWLDSLISDCKVLDINEGTSHYYAAINLELRQAGRPIPTNDLWIAALCRQYSLPLLSRDRHFDLVRGIRRIEW
ncbi:MAG TPA: type II toxin-antitoxin system VapC family toxin [Terriglobales bacterium]|nr:type II toxin-antitoxin system VapC family toxin [Terriglobales bacterium]